jgi:phenylalanine-4-hydroxylase
MSTQARPRRLENRISENGDLLPSYATSVIEQPYEHYVEEDHLIWGELMRRQEAVLKTRACPEWLSARHKLGLSEDHVPDFAQLNKSLGPASGWQLVAVEGLLPGEFFFDLLASRQFPVTWWMRSRTQFDYLPEPDLFHDAYGHVPMLLNPVFGDFVQHYAAASLRATGDTLTRLSRLYWFTVEFGLMGTPESPWVYGAGILSSIGESVHAVDNPLVERVIFDPVAAMSQDYKIDVMQNKYFVVKDLKTLYASVKPILDAI